MKGSQAQPNQRIRFTGRFSNTIIRLNPTNLHSQFLILQLNCHNQKDTTLSALNNKQQHISLLFQEPWVYHHNFKPPTHQAWRRLTPITSPGTWAERPWTCIYICSFVPLKNITFSNTNSQNLTQVAIDILLKGISQKLTFFALYNPPRTFSGLQELEQRLSEMNTRLYPMVIAMDSNLLHQLWNPKNYHHQHPQARNILEICGRRDFKFISPKGEPTFMGASGSATTIDLTWANTIANKIISQCKVQLENHSSDHQPIISEFNIGGKAFEITETPISMNPSMLDKGKYINQLQYLSQPTKEGIEEIAKQLSNFLQNEYLSQGKYVKTRANKQKAWWDKKILMPIMKEGNRERKWMLLTRSGESKLAKRV
ncbi:hypothetical protein O181_020266 [Austropuccinia psidii MF-1]|uniref:Endonuclease/exonuclease/phosphatase domain-containing protein n=1 Tax=Austropuccinia psidii MF-1 TaxID=1389203 RepID=A0A9Q3GUN5_9BASI|nr:hypothetical protein [Austropuccinia psidii MF-1]